MTDDDLLEEMTRAMADFDQSESHQTARPGDYIGLARAALAVARKQECVVLDSYADENQRFHDEILRLRAALTRIRDHYDDTGLAAKHMAAIARAAIGKPQP